jgi:hypothetical protein
MGRLWFHFPSTHLRSVSARRRSCKLCSSSTVKHLHRQISSQRRQTPSPSSITKKAKSRTQLNEEELREMPKWPAVVSMLMVPVLFGAWHLSDYVFGNRQIGLNERLRQDFQQQYSLETLEPMPPKLYCVVRKTHGFTHCLTGVQIGDVVEVLEEGVGPQKEYNVCRLPAKNNNVSADIYGWFPFRWLQTLDHYQAIVRKQQEQQQQQQRHQQAANQR